jgi:hypothetical protein
MNKVIWKGTMLAIATVGMVGIGCGKDSGGSGELPPLLEIRTGGALVFGEPKKDCVECHPNHVEEWSMSMHAYATADPVFHAMSVMGQAQSKGKLGQFCVQCHAPIGLAFNAAPVTFDAEKGQYVQDTRGLDPLSASGVSCDVCHSITNIIEPLNARAVLTPNGIRRGTIKDPVETPAHASAYSPLHEESLVCSMCHAVTNPRGAKLEETFPEWENSSFNGRQTCQDCHMVEYDGKASPDGPMRKLHRHWMPGVDVSLLPENEFPGYQQMRDIVTDLLQNSAELSARATPANKKLEVTVRNLAGHALPSGATAERQMWLETIVRTSTGAVVFESGTLDARMDLRQDDPKKTLMPGTDPQLRLWFQQMVDDPKKDDPNSTKPLKKVNMPWQANERINYLIDADGSATHEYDLSMLGPGQYSVTVRLMFRTFPPYFLRELIDFGTGLDPAVLDRVPIVEMETTEASFTIN